LGNVTLDVCYARLFYEKYVAIVGNSAVDYLSMTPRSSPSNARLGHRLSEFLYRGEAWTGISVSLEPFPKKALTLPCPRWGAKTPRWLSGRDFGSYRIATVMKVRALSFGRKRLAK